MEKSNQIAGRFKEIFLNGKWVANTNYQDQLSTLSWQEATKKVGDLNTIASLAAHINYYLKGVLNVFEGGTLDIKDKYSFDFSAITSTEDWQHFLIEMWVNVNSFATHIDLMSDEKLASAFVDEKYGSYRRNIEGMIEHSYYHLGQISLIKKMLTTNSITSK